MAAPERGSATSGCTHVGSRFLPFGEELNAQAPPHDRKLFTGQERDGETGLDYLHARRLRVDLGRFTAPDPLTNLAWTDPARGASSPYGYLWNNPLGFVDPMGAEGDQVSGGVGQWDCQFVLLIPCKGTISTTVVGTAPYYFVPAPWWSYLSVDVTDSITIVPGSGSGTPTSNATTQAPSDGTTKCSGGARVLQGNAATIGKPGGFSGPSAGTFRVTTNGAAIIPSQWGMSKSALRPYINRISGEFRQSVVFLTPDLLT